MTLRVLYRSVRLLTALVRRSPEPDETTEGFVDPDDETEEPRVGG